jgi:hypothetical protein
MLDSVIWEKIDFHAKEGIQITTGGNKVPVLIADRYPYSTGTYFHC